MRLSIACVLILLSIPTTASANSITPTVLSGDLNGFSNFQGETPEQIKEKLGKVLLDKVIRTPVEDLDVKASVALDNPNAGPQHFDVSVNFDNLKDEVQKQAQGLGFVKGDKVTVRVNAKTWEPKVLSTVSFDAQIQELIPPKEPGGRPSLRVVAKFDALSPQLRSSAKAFGYREGEMVNLLAKSPSTPLEVLPRSAAAAEPAPSFRFGLRSPFAKLKKDVQKRALKLGYKEGDTVWEEFVQGKMELVPPNKVGDGPEIELVSAKINPMTNELSLIGVARFNRLTQAAQAEARRYGYKEGDRVAYEVKRSGGGPILLGPSEVPRTTP